MSEKLLMHKDIVVANVNVEKGQPLSINEVYDAKHMPIGGNSNEQLNHWLANRNVPVSRNNFDLIADQIGIHNNRDFILFSSGASLTDCYWFANENDLIQESVSWSGINYFENTPKSNIGHIMFSGDEAIIDGYETPDITTNGHLPKYWLKSDNKWFLIKSQKQHKQEVFNEIIASRIAEMAGIDAVQYYYTHIDGKLCSVCANIIQNDQSEMISFADLKRAGLNKRDLPEYAKAHNSLRPLQEMSYLDYLVCNEDRNDGNLAFLRDSDDLFIYGMAPLYDHGESFGYNPFDKTATRPDSIRSNITGNKLTEDFQQSLRVCLKKVDKNDVEDIIDKLSKKINIDPGRSKTIRDATIDRILFANRSISRYMEVER